MHSTQCSVRHAAAMAHPAAPAPFRHLCRLLRGLFGIDNSQYILSICGDQALREMPSPGKSGRCAGVVGWCRQGPLGQGQAGDMCFPRKSGRRAS